jgi:hypothetical protein
MDLSIETRQNSLLQCVRWYLGSTLPRCDRQGNLPREVRGLRLLPWHRRALWHARKVTTVSAPFFPRNPFIASDLKLDRWLEAQCTLGGRSEAGVLLQILRRGAPVWIGRSALVSALTA